MYVAWIQARSEPELINVLTVLNLDALHVKSSKDQLPTSLFSHKISLKWKVEGYHNFYFTALTKDLIILMFW